MIAVALGGEPGNPPDTNPDGVEPELYAPRLAEFKLPPLDQEPTQVKTFLNCPVVEL